MRDVEGCGGVWRGVEGCGGVWRGVEGCGGVWRDVEGCGGVWRGVEGCGGVWRGVEGCGGVWRGVEGCGGGGGGGGGGAPAVVPRTVSRGVVPRGPHAGSAEGVLRLTSARVRRISSHTSEHSSQQAVWVTASAYDNATVRSALRSQPPTAPNCPGSTRVSVPRSTGTEDVDLPGHHPRLRTSPDKERGPARLRTAPGRSGRVRSRTGHGRGQGHGAGRPRATCMSLKTVRGPWEAAVRMAENAECSAAHHEGITSPQRPASSPRPLPP